MTIRAQLHRSSTVPTRTKPAARTPRACTVRNRFQAWPAGGAQDRSRRHAGSATRGDSNPVAGPEEFAVHAPVPPHRIAHRDADHDLADRGWRRRPPGMPPARIIPSARGHPPVPGEQRRQGHGEHLSPPVPGISRDSAGSHSRPAGSGPGRSCGAAPRSPATPPAARRPWIPHAGPAPSGSRAGNTRASNRPGRSLSDNLSPQASQTE
jgi:hypothetical protein